MSDEQHAMVLSRNAAPVEPGRIMASRPHGTPGLLFGSHGRRTVCAAEITRPVCAFLGRPLGRMDRIPWVPRHRVVLHPRFPLAEAQTSVAPAESPDRHLPLYWCDSRGPAGHDGPHNALWFGRTICCFRRDIRDRL